MKGIYSHLKIRHSDFTYSRIYVACKASVISSYSNRVLPDNSSATFKQWSKNLNHCGSVFALRYSRRKPS